MTYEQWVKEISKTTYLSEGKGEPRTCDCKCIDLFYQNPEDDEVQQEA